jgi:hypothetical protein
MNTVATSGEGNVLCRESMMADLSQLAYFPLLLGSFSVDYTHDIKVFPAPAKTSNQHQRTDVTWEGLLTRTNTIQCPERAKQPLFVLRIVEDPPASPLKPSIA